MKIFAVLALFFGIAPNARAEKPLTYYGSWLEGSAGVLFGKNAPSTDFEELRLFKIVAATQSGLRVGLSGVSLQRPLGKVVESQGWWFKQEVEPLTYFFAPLYLGWSAKRPSGRRIEIFGEWSAWGKARLDWPQGVPACNQYGGSSSSYDDDCGPSTNKAKFFQFGAEYTLPESFVSFKLVWLRQEVESSTRRIPTWWGSQTPLKYAGYRKEGFFGGVSLKFGHFSDEK